MKILLYAIPIYLFFGFISGLVMEYREAKLITVRSIFLSFNWCWMIPLMVIANILNSIYKFFYNKRNYQLFPFKKEKR